MRRPPPLVALAIIAVLIVFAAYAITSSPMSITSPVPSKFTLNGRTFSLTDTATNDAQRNQGLMNTKVTNTTFMLFVFPAPGYYKFWMYETNTSLDMIWVNSAGNLGRVVYIVTSAEPCYKQESCSIYAPSSAANYVLEARSGFVQTNGIEVGTEIQFG